MSMSGVEVIIFSASSSVRERDIGAVLSVVLDAAAAVRGIMRNWL